MAALATSVCWSFTSILFAVSGRQVGSPVVNRTRLLFAVVMVSLLHWLLEGQLLPLDAAGWRWGWMALSGVIGFVLGDAALFQAFVLIGPRLAMLLMALSPVLGALLGWVLLNEELAAAGIVGIALAVSGGRVGRGRPDQHARRDRARRAARTSRSASCGLGGAVSQAAGLIASKRGLEGDFSALSGNLMRLVASAALIWLIAAVAGTCGATSRGCASIRAPSPRSSAGRYSGRCSACGCR